MELPELPARRADTRRDRAAVFFLIAFGALIVLAASAVIALAGEWLIAGIVLAVGVLVIGAIVLAS